jgi:hypothetical protein
MSADLVRIPCMGGSVCTPGFGVLCNLGYVPER